MAFADSCVFLWNGPCKLYAGIRKYIFVGVNLLLNRPGHLGNIYVKKLWLVHYGLLMRMCLAISSLRFFVILSGF